MVNFIITSYTKKDFHAYEKKNQKRRKATIRIYDLALEGKPQRIPVPYWEYNQHMESTDQHSQLKASYSTSHLMRRVWWPLLFNMIDAADVNVYVIYKAISERPLTYRKCQLVISKKLREKDYRKLLAIHVTNGLGGLR